VPLITQLPSGLEDAEALLKRREKAKTRKEMWRSTYQDCFRYAMPARETFSWQTEGQKKNSVLYDSTLQESTYTAANTLCALLFPGWTRWMELAPGGALPTDKPVDPKIIDGLQGSTEIFFNYLNHSNFAQVINETALDLMVGTGALSFDEGDNDQPFVFTSIPLSAIELEEGPNGKIETTFMCRRPLARNLVRMYAEMESIDLPPLLLEKIQKTPDAEIEIIQGEIFDPETRKYYGVVVWSEGKAIIWRYDFGASCPTIVARATKCSGELYGRGRVMLALSDARTLDKMQEFVLRHSAVQVAGAFTGVSDGVLNPYTAIIAPNIVIPVASNDSANPSLRPLEIGGNFQITEALMGDLRQRVRRTMLGPEPSEGSVRSATEVGVNDRNRLWAMNGEFGRIQAELLAKIVARGVAILQKRGLMAAFKVDGRLVSVKYTSPFAKSQAMEDVQAMQTLLGYGQLIGPQMLMQGIKVEDVPGWVAEKLGVPVKFVRSDAEKKELGEQVAQATAQNPEGTAAAVGMMTGGG
jgi:hypothetical protein